MKHLSFFYFNLYLLAPRHHNHRKEALKEHTAIKSKALLKIFQEPRFKKASFVKHPETLTNWNYFINILNQLSKNLKITIATFPSEEKEKFYKDLTIFLDNLTSFFYGKKMALQNFKISSAAK